MTVKSAVGFEWDMYIAVAVFISVFIRTRIRKQVAIDETRWRSNSGDNMRGKG